MKMHDLVHAAQEYDRTHRPREGNWRRVADSQVARLLRGAKLALEEERENEQRQGHLTNVGD